MACWSRTFPGLPEQVGQARLFTTSVLAGRPEADTAALVVSELATNALRHTASGNPGGTFLVVVWARGDGVRVAVYDLGSAGAPAITPASGGELRASGHGLVLVAMLAKEWGATRTRSGRRVWAELAAADSAGARL
jgi:serine/threonine-protein kinase RsbW